MRDGQRRVPPAFFPLRRRPWVPVFAVLAGMLIGSGTGSPVAQEVRRAEDYCVRCHDAHDGVDMEANTCLTCHELVRRGQMNLYPWFSSEAALAGICCTECHRPESCRGDACLSCHSRHADPLR